MIAYIVLFLLGVSFCFYYKYKIVIEGLKCDPDKPKVYPTRNGKRYGERGNYTGRGNFSGEGSFREGDYQPSARECQGYYESTASSNLESYEEQLEKVKEELNEVKSKFKDEETQHNENVSNTKKLISSLNCKRDTPRKGDIDCSEDADEGENDIEGEGDEVDLTGETRNARNDAAKAEIPTFKF